MTLTSGCLDTLSPELGVRARAVVPVARFLPLVTVKEFREHPGSLRLGADGGELARDPRIPVP